jgi:arsenite methyltransferase
VTNAGEFMTDWKAVDYQVLEFGEFYDEVPLWSVPFGLMLLDRVPMRSHQTILDVGAGTGYLSIELAQRCDPSKVIAVDPWKAATIRFRRKIDYLGLKNIQIIEGDAANLELPADSVDVILSNLGINNFANASDVLRACHRVARPGGRIFMTSNLVGTMQEFYGVFGDVLRDAGDRDRLDKLDAHIRHRATPASLRSQLERTGFQVVDVAESSFRIRFADGTAMLNHFFMRLGFLPAWLEILAPDDDFSLRNALEQRLNTHAAQAGELALTIPMAVVEAEKPRRP